MAEKKENLISRAPVVVILGHIDSGKTSILDAIRKTHIAEKETGGITQHIGAYEIEHAGKKITFLDTPGHEAFSQMRTRGAKVADIAILIVDSCKGVEEQTKEAISIIKKTSTSLIVALNKIDRSEANPEKAKRELSKEGILVESLGGNTPSVETSAKTGKGIEDLLDLVLLVSEMEGLKSDLSKSAEGAIIESYLDQKRGMVATIILDEGKLELGTIISTPTVFGKIKILEDFQGNPIKEAIPSQPAIVLGFEDCPMVGEKFKVFLNLEEAKKNLKISERKEIPRVLNVLPEQKVLNLILKADCIGSIEPIEEVLKEIPQEKVILRILKSEAGQINENDVKLARSSKSLVLGFRVKANPLAQKLAEKDKIKIMNFEIIYDLVEELRKFMIKIAKPKIVRRDLAKLSVVATFFSEKNRQIVGGKVSEGEIKRGTQIEVFRNDELIGKGKLINLQKNKRDVEKVPRGELAGILFEGNAKIQDGDILVFYIEEKEGGNV